MGSNDLALNRETGELKPVSTGMTEGQMMDATVEREAKLVEAQILVAQRCRRDEEQALERIKKACKRPGLAAQSQYEYKRGGTPITGPSIKLAEAIAQAWGNLDYGVRELHTNGFSTVVECYCYDLETNLRRSKVFNVPHERHTRSGVTKLSDPRDIYETIANNASRRLRACILGVIPADIVDAAVEQCNKTLHEFKNPDVIQKLQAAYSEIGVTKAQLEERLGHKLEASSGGEINRLRFLYKTIKDGYTSVEDEFGGDSTPPADPPAVTDREQLKVQYIELCESKGITPKDMTRVSTDNIIKNIEEVKASNGA